VSPHTANRVESEIARTPRVRPRVGGDLARGYGWFLALVCGLRVCAACASGEELPSEAVRPGASEAGAGATLAGSAGSVGSGGSLGSGGAASSTGGYSTDTGGALTGSGGAPGGAGSTSADGSTSSGGSAGASSTGGSVGSGGAASASGGAPSDGGPGSGTVLFSDDFEGASTGWAVAPPGSDWSIVADGSNVYKQGTLDTVFHVASAGDVAWTDQIVEAKVKVLAFSGSSTSYLAGVFARFKDLDNHYYAALQSDGQFKIKKKSGGNNSSLSSGAKVTITTNTWYTVNLSVIGSALTAYLDGTLVLTATDTDIAAGGMAVGTKNATAEFDDVKVSAP